MKCRMWLPFGCEPVERGCRESRWTARVGNAVYHPGREGGEGKSATMGARRGMAMRGKSMSHPTCCDARQLLWGSLGEGLGLF